MRHEPPAGDGEKINAFFAGAIAAVACFHGLAVKRVPFQCQIRDLVPPVGQQCWSPGRRMLTVSRMSEPAALTCAPLPGRMTSCHEPSAQRKTAQPSNGTDIPPEASDTTMVWLPGPMKAPADHVPHRIGHEVRFPQVEPFDDPSRFCLGAAAQRGRDAGRRSRRATGVADARRAERRERQERDNADPGRPKCEPIPGTAGCAVGRSHFRTVTVRMELTVFPALSVAFTVIVARAR